MANITPSYVIAHPSYVMPEMIMQFSQASGFLETFATADIMPRLSEGDLYAYVKRVDVRTKVAGGQTAYNQLPSVTINAQMVSTPTYLLRNRAEYDHHDQAAGSQWGISIVEAQRLGMRQGIFQQIRNAALYGFNPLNGEGLVNSAGATSVNLPADSNGNTTVTTYDNGQMAFFLLGQIAALKTRTLQIGMPSKITILAPQRVIAQWEYPGIVQLTQFQRVGAGTDTTGGVVKSVLMENGDEIIMACDDTLIAQGSGGTDLVIMTVPEVKVPTRSKINTNVFAQLSPNLEACNIILCDMAAPKEIPTPLPGGAIDVVSELRITSGWGLRPETLTLISMGY